MVVTSLLMILAHFVGANPVLEQPVSSCMPKLEPLQSTLRGIGAVANSHNVFEGYPNLPAIHIREHSCGKAELPISSDFLHLLRTCFRV